MNLPAIAEQDMRVPIGVDRYHQWRAGELLHPETLSMEVLDSLRSQMGSDAFSAQYLQNPIPPGGNMIKRHWIGRYDNVPARLSSDRIIQSWDTASKDGGQNDWSVCTTWLVRDGKYYLIAVVRRRLDYPALKALAMEHARVHNATKILVEDSGVGTSLIAELKVAGRPAIGVKVEGDKETRMAVQSVKFESGQVLLPNSAPWLEVLEMELFAFPGARHDDQVDSISQALGHEITGGYDTSLRWVRGD